MDEKQLSNNVPILDTELSGIINRLETLRVDLNIGIHGSYDTSEKDEERTKIEPSLRSIADKIIDVQRLLTDIEPLCAKIRASSPVSGSSP